MFHMQEKIESGGVYVIAEMSANHGGKLENALEIVRQAAKTGADCIKIQTYTADSMTIDCDSDLFMIKGGLWDGYNLYRLYKEAFTPYEWQKEIKDECERCGVDFLSTPFDTEAVDFLESIGTEAYKIASFELVDIPLIEYAASKDKPMIISTGMGSVEEIREAVNACKRKGNDQIVLLKCCSEYPSNWEDMHLGNIPDMQKRFGVKVGLSDHSFGSLGAAVGVALGACVVEKHIKIDGIDSPDSKFSMTMEEFASMIEDIKAAKNISKGPTYELSEKEESSKVFRRSIFAVSDIEEGEKFSKDNIRIIRPSYGLPPKYYNDILNKQSSRKIVKGEPLGFNDIKDFQGDSKFRFELRNVNEGDMDLLYQWANDIETRKNSFHTEMIEYKDHKKWFENLLSDPSKKQYIFMIDDKPLGQIRFIVDDKEAEIGYSIAPGERGNGYGKIMMELAIKKFHDDYPNVEKLIGRVRKDNKTSATCFLQSGFEEVFDQFELCFSKV